VGEKWAQGFCITTTLVMVSTGGYGQKFGRDTFFGLTSQRGISLTPQ
jgi:hypothetical protein